MNLELTDEQTQLRDTVRHWCADRAGIADHVRPLLDDPTGTTDAVWRELAGLGATGVLVPEELGGAGLTMVEAGVVAEELGAGLHPGPWLATAITATRTLTRLHGAGRENVDALLTGIADGSSRTAVGPLHGDRPRATGDTVDGQVPALPGAAAASVLLILADDGDEIGLYAVDPTAAGVTVTPRSHIDPTHKLADVVLDGVPARRLGALAPEDLAAVVDDVLIASGADALGAARAVLDIAVDHAKVRRQFGAPIGSFQAVAHLCVDMYETVELARGGVIHALWAADQTASVHPYADRVSENAYPCTLAPLERHLAALRVRAFARRLATVGDTAIQVLGGIGFTWEHDAHLYLERLLGFSALLGSTDHYLESVGRALAAAVTERN